VARKEEQLMRSSMESKEIQLEVKKAVPENEYTGEKKQLQQTTQSRNQM